MPTRRGASGRPPRWSISRATLATAGERVLVIDLDPQGNATSGLGIDRATLDRSIYDAVIDDARLSELLVAGPTDGLSMSSRHRSPWPVPRSSWRRSNNANDGCRGSSGTVAADYDYILIDSPPSLGLLTVNALTAADSVLVPLQCEYYALEGLTQLIATINLVRDHLNPASRSRASC